MNELNVLRGEENAAYEAFSVSWWGTSGQYRGWIDRYREVVAGQVPTRVEAENVGAGFLAQVVEVPEGSFKPIAPLRAVWDYMQMIGRVYANRRSQPLQPLEGAEEGAPETRH